MPLKIYNDKAERASSTKSIFPLHSATYKANLYRQMVHYAAYLKGYHARICRKPGLPYSTLLIPGDYTVRLKSVVPNWRPLVSFRKDFVVEGITTRSRTVPQYQSEFRRPLWACDLCDDVEINFASFRREQGECIKSKGKRTTSRCKSQLHESTSVRQALINVCVLHMRILLLAFVAEVSKYVDSTSWKTM